jgi:hypothetical protein
MEEWFTFSTAGCDFEFLRPTLQGGVQMAKRNTGRSRLPDLFAAAEKLQAVVKSLRPYAEESAELDAAYGSTKLALDAIVIEILQNYLSDVELQLDPRRPQRWEDYFATLEVIYDGTTIKMPVPKPRGRDAELAKRIERGTSMIKRTVQEVNGQMHGVDLDENGTVLHDYGPVWKAQGLRLDRPIGRRVRFDQVVGETPVVRRRGEGDVQLPPPVQTWYTAEELPQLRWSWR